MLRGVLVAGPLQDGLWTYVVAAFLRDGDKVRVNLVVFPHARITQKATGLVSAERFDKWVADLHKAGVLRREPPEAARKEKDEKKRDGAYSLLLATWDAEGKGRKDSYAKPEEEEEGKRDAFQETLGAILKDVESTYPPEPK